MSWEALFNWGLETVLMTAILIAFVLLIRRPFAKAFGANAAYALWLLPVSRLFLPGLEIPRIFPEKAPKSIEIDPAAIDPSMVDMMWVTPPTAQIETAMADPIITAPIVIIFWLLGSILFLTHAVLKDSAYFDKIKYNSHPVSPRTQLFTQGLAKHAGLKQCPEICMADGHIGPLVAHATRPVVYLPEDFETDFTLEQQRYALLHELTHIRRGDLWVAWAWLIFRAINWPNPLVHYAARAFRSDQEAACDASVLRKTNGGKDSVVAYAETLLQAAKLSTASNLSTGRASPKMGQLALTIHQPMKERLVMLNTKKTRTNWAMRAGAGAMIIAAFGLTAPITQADNHPDPELAGKSETKKNVSKSVIKFNKTDDDGKSVRKHYEISVDGDKVEAFEIDEFGRKTAIDPNEIEDLDIDAHDHAFKGLGKHGDIVLKRLTEDDLAVWTKNEFEDWKEGEFKDWEEGELAEWREEVREKAKAHGLEMKNRFHFSTEDGEMIFLGKDGETSFVMPIAPTPPTPPSLREGFEVKELRLKGFMHAEEMRAGSQMKAATSMLAAAERMLDSTEMTDKNKRKLEKAKRDLEKARKSLEEAEEALRDE